MLLILKYILKLTNLHLATYKPFNLNPKTLLQFIIEVITQISQVSNLSFYKNRTVD